MKKAHEQIVAEAKALLAKEGEISGDRWRVRQGYDWTGAVQSVCNGNPFLSSKTSREVLGEHPPTESDERPVQSCTCGTLFPCSDH